MDNEKEQLPLVDEEGNIKGCITRGEAHGGSMLLHPVVHLHVFNSRGELYLQHRPAWKDIQPNKWDTACGGHVNYGETILNALHREVGEELGIFDYTPRFLTRYIFESQRERELVNVFVTHYDRQIAPSADELDGGRFWGIDEIKRNIGKGILTPNFENEFIKVLSQPL